MTKLKTPTHVFKERGGKGGGGGKGYLGADELAFTLSTHPDQSILTIMSAEDKIISNENKGVEWDNYRIRIEGYVNGEKWSYDDPEDKKSGVWYKDDVGLMYFYWEQGNYSCDCNRFEYLFPNPKKQYYPCGESIRICRITPVDNPEIPILELDEHCSCKQQTAYSIQGNIIGRKDENGGNGVGMAHEVCGTLTKMDVHGVVTICFDPTQITSPQNASNPKENGPSPTLAKGAHAPVLIEKAYSDTVGRGFREHKDVFPTILRNAGTGGGNVPFVHNVIIRRLTPTECLRLQGFPDNYLCNVPGYSDSKAYAATGNSMTTNVMAWIGGRIDAVDKILKEVNKNK